MPYIDVTDVLVSLDIACQEFYVLRRRETVNEHGESVKDVETIGPLTGACQPLGDNSMVREEAYTTQNNGLSVWSTFRMYSTSRTNDGTTYQPDLILYDGNTYLVKTLNDWTAWGAGFTQADCIAFAYVPAPGQM